MNRLHLSILILGMLFLFSCEKDNHPPVIQSLTATPEDVETGGIVSLNCIASDDDGDPLTFSWIASKGSFPDGDIGESVTWQAPEEVGQFSISIDVNDGETSTQDAMIITVNPKNVTTSMITHITDSKATGGGSVISIGGSDVGIHGVCWSTSENPTISDDKTNDGSGPGEFTSLLSDLIANTTYYVRAYAEIDLATSYGTQVSFMSAEGSFTDLRDSTTYGYTSIGTQTWMMENLAYLPSVSNPNDGSLINLHYYVYGYEGTSISAAKATDNYDIYGVLYNWEATRGACPAGWHLSSDEEWKILEKYLGMSSSDADNTKIWRNSGDVGLKLKSTSGWHNNGNGTNSSGFNIVPAGRRSNTSGFVELGTYTYFSTSSDRDLAQNQAWIRSLGFDDDGAYRSTYNKEYAHSVRCIQD